MISGCRAASAARAFMPPARWGRPRASQNAKVSQMRRPRARRLAKCSLDRIAVICARAAALGNRRLICDCIMGTCPCDCVMQVVWHMGIRLFRPFCGYMGGLVV